VTERIVRCIPHLRTGSDVCWLCLASAGALGSDLDFYT
jgi:hypothetical protein